METIEINHNDNGRIFSDHFSIIIPRKEMHVEVTEEYQIKLQGIPMGTVIVEAIKEFPFARLNDVVSFLVIGKPLQYLAERLNRQYNHGRTIEPAAAMLHIVVGYRQRNIENQSPFMEEWWQQKKDYADN